MKKAIATVSMIAALGSVAPAVSAEGASHGNNREVCTLTQVPNGTRETCKEFLGKRLIEKTTTTDLEFVTQTATERTDKIKDTVNVVRYAFRKGHPYIKFESTKVENRVITTSVEQPTQTTPVSTNTTPGAITTTTPAETTPTTTTSTPTIPAANNNETASYTSNAGYYDQGNFYSTQYNLTVDADWTYSNGQITSDTINYSTNIPAGDGFNPTESATLNSSDTEVLINAYGTFSTQNQDTGAYMSQDVGISGELYADGTSSFQNTSNNGG